MKSFSILCIFMYIIFVQCDIGSISPDKDSTGKYIEFNIQAELSSIREQLNHESSIRLQFDKDLTEMARQYRILSGENEKLSKENVQLKHDLQAFINKSTDIANQQCCELETEGQNVNNLFKTQEWQQTINDIARNFTLLENEYIAMRQNVTVETKRQNELSSEVQGYLQALNDHVTSWNATLSSILPVIETLKKEVLERKFRDCGELYTAKPNSMSGVYQIYPDGTVGYSAYCDMTTNGGGWTVIQRRVDGFLNFERTWLQYKQGFGDPAGEYWLGNEALHELTKLKQRDLYFKILTTSDVWKYAAYQSLNVDSEANKYRLSVNFRSYTGNAGNMFNSDISGIQRNNLKFTTKDRDSDRNGVRNCASIYQGGWWFYNCNIGCLNCNYQTSAGRWGSLHLKSSWIMLR